RPSSPREPLLRPQQKYANLQLEPAAPKRRQQSRHGTGPRWTMRVLVAIDGSKASEIVLHGALERPWLPGTRFCLITVVDPFFFTRAPILFEEAKEAASNLLEEAAEKLRGTGWETETNVVMGNPRRAISHFAEEWHADLVLVGSHGLNLLERLALGSTVRSVLRHTRCSVEVVRAPKKEAQAGTRKILVA